MATLMARLKRPDKAFSQRAVTFGKNGKPVPVEGATSYFVLYRENGKRKATKSTTLDLALVDLRRVEAVKAGSPEVIQQFKEHLPEKPNGSLTLRKALDKYLDELKDGKAPATVENYRVALEEFVERAGGDKLIGTMDRGVVLTYKRWLYTQDLSETTRHNRLLRVVMLLKHFGIEKVLLKTDWPTPNEPVPDAYSDEELEALFGAANPEEKLLLEFFLYSGARDMEIAHATKGDVRLNGGATLTICAKDGWRTKGKRDRAVPLPWEFAERLLAARQNYRPDDLLFPNSHRGPNVDLLKILKDVAERAGVKDAKLHKFRRTFATKHAAAGTPIHVIKEWLGHRDIQTTLRYLQATASESDAARQMTEKAFGNLAGK